MALPLGDYARYNSVETAKKNDCQYCLYFIGKVKRDRKWCYVCDRDICPAELVGYDARKIYGRHTEAKEVIA
jgi:hypothetical protein